MSARLAAFATHYARLALGIAFLSAVASRLGLVPGWGGGWTKFLAYAAKVNSFAPPAIRPALAVAATVCEVSLGVALVLGLRVRIAAWGSAALLALFGLAMAISFGPKEPLDYSVFSASACALLLAARVEGTKAPERQI